MFMWHKYECYKQVAIFWRQRTCFHWLCFIMANNFEEVYLQIPWAWVFWKHNTEATTITIKLQPVMIRFPPKVGEDDQQKNQQKVNILHKQLKCRNQPSGSRERNNSSYSNESKWHLSVKFGLTGSHSASSFCSSVCIPLHRCGEWLQQSSPS